MALRVKIHSDGSPEHRRGLQQLAALGVSLPSSWQPFPNGSVDPAERRIWLWHEHPSAPLGVMLSVSRSRRVPWARIAHIEDLGGEYYADHAARLAQMIRIGTELVGRVMRVDIRLLHRDASVRESLASALQQVGARVAASNRMYRHTHVLDLVGTAEEMFARLPAVARRRITLPTRRGLRVGTNVTHVTDLPRLLDLMDVAFARTGGHAKRPQWKLDFTRALHEPLCNPLVTLELGEREGADRIVAFALGAWNGDHVTYRHGASERGGGLGSLPLGYAPVWGLARYGLQHGARWFDLGGIADSSDPHHALAGITAFKRTFGGEDAIVADELRITLSDTNVQLEKRVGDWLGR